MTPTEPVQRYPVSHRCPQGLPRLNIPWSAFEPGQARAQRNHGQTLERLAERGGLAHIEALAILDDKSEREVLAEGWTEELAHIELARRYP